MIFEILITGITGIIIGLFDLLPDLPQWPQEMTTILNTFNNWAVHAGQFLHFWYGSLLPYILGISIAVLLFVEGYKFIMFILKKIPVLNIN